MQGQICRIETTYSMSKPPPDCASRVSSKERRDAAAGTALPGGETAWSNLLSLVRMSRWTRTTVLTNAEREGVMVSALTFGEARRVVSPEFSEACGLGVIEKLSGITESLPASIIKLLCCNER